MTTDKKFDIAKWLGWIVAAGTIAAWLMTSGMILGQIVTKIEIISSEIQKIDAKIENQTTIQQEHFIKQLIINTKVLKNIDDQEKINERILDYINKQDKKK